MLAYLFVLFAIVVRLTSSLGWIGTMGFTPLGAALLFFGSRMPRKHYLAPLGLLVLTDIYLTTVAYKMPIGWDQVAVWAWYVGAFFLGSLLKDRVKPLYVAGAAVGSALSFFLLSNFAVWLAGQLYPRTLAGLVSCYTLAIPFFEKGLASDLIFSAIFFAVPVALASPARAQAKVAAK